MPSGNAGIEVRRRTLLAPGSLVADLMHPISEGLHLQVDSVMEADMKENGFRSTRRTKLICTIGPASCSFQQLETLASGGMNVARLNMCHGTHDWHRCVVVLPVVLVCCSGHLNTHSVFLWGT